LRAAVPPEVQPGKLFYLSFGEHERNKTKIRTELSREPLMGWISRT
jgi:hypothetical protein